MLLRRRFAAHLHEAIQAETEKFMGASSMEEVRRIQGKIDGLRASAEVFETAVKEVDYGETD